MLPYRTFRCQFSQQAGWFQQFGCPDLALSPAACSSRQHCLMLLDLQLLAQGKSVLLIQCQRRISCCVVTVDWLQFSVGNWMSYVLALPHVDCVT